MKRPRPTRAFTLMEVIVTVIVLGTGIVLLAQGLTAAIRSNARVQRVTRAAMVADEVFQRMELGEIDFMTQGEGTLADTGPEAGSSGAGEEEESYREVFRWVSSVETWEDENLYRVDLTVTWFEFEFEKSEEFTRLFYKPDEEEDEEGG